MALITVVVVAATAAGLASAYRWPGGASATAQRGLTVALYSLVPFVAFVNLARLELTVDVGVGIGLSYGALAAVGVVAWFVADHLLGLSPAQTGALICVVIVVNSAYLGYPATVAILGGDALPQAVAFDVLVAAPMLLVGAFAVGAAFGTSATGTRARLLSFFSRNPPLIAAAAGLLAPESLAPQALVDASYVIVIALLPLGFWAVGVTLGEQSGPGRLRLPPALSAPVAVAMVLRLAVAPGLLALAAAPLIDLPDPYLLLAAMPTGINSLIVAHAYGLDRQLVASTIFWSTAVALVGAVILA
ncbi:MAG: AEC family transporter [Solirubrobacterales bacterium]